MEHLLLRRIAALVPEFAVKDLPLGRTLMMMIIIITIVITITYMYICICCSSYFLVGDHCSYFHILT